jgi:hypothetical protein
MYQRIDGCRSNRDEYEYTVPHGLGYSFVCRIMEHADIRTLNQDKRKLAVNRMQSLHNPLQVERWGHEQSEVGGSGVGRRNVGRVDLLSAPTRKSCGLIAGNMLY